jgi:hypothetical protein
MSHESHNCPHKRAYRLLLYIFFYYYFICLFWEFIKTTLIIIETIHRVHDTMIDK